MNLELYVTTKNTETLRALAASIKHLNSLQEKKKSATEQSIFPLLGEEKAELDFYITQLKNLIALFNKLYTARRVNTFDAQYQSLETKLLEIIGDVQEYKTIIEIELQTQSRNPARENQALDKIRQALNKESIESLNFQTVLQRALQKEDLPSWTAVQKALMPFREGSLFLFGNRNVFSVLPSMRLCAALALFGLVACNEPEQQNTRSTPQIQQQSSQTQVQESIILPQLDDISYFNHIQNVLILCANDSEKAGVIQTLKERNGRRKKSAQFHIEKRGNASVIDDWPVKDNRGNIQRVKVNIVSYGQEIPSVRGGYQLITLRGHTGDMQNLFSEASKYEATYTTYIFGGCEGVQFVQDFMTSRRAIIADRQVGEAANNTYVLTLIIDRMAQQASWDALNRDIKGLSQRAASQTFLPGDSL